MGSDRRRSPILSPILSPIPGRDATGPAARPTEMRAIVQDTYGSADVLRFAHIARPTPAVDEVLVQVHAAGLDRGTWHLMTGKPYLQRLALGYRRPKRPVPGRDVAGTVVAVGRQVTDFSAGDAVYGIGHGTFAEFTTARADKLARKPGNLTFEQAGVVPVSGMTALRALTDVGRVTAGQRVLITGASGGVGSYAVQIAKALGAEVTGVSSAAKADLVLSLGADHVIDYTRHDFADGTRRYDLIIDIAGNPTIARLRHALVPNGTAVIVGGEGGGNLTGGMNRQLWALTVSPFVRAQLAMVIPNENAADLRRLSALIETGQLTPSIDRSYPLDQAREAMRHLQDGNVRGKVVITL
jgi:NADPH:quinone reductase-like Zn-dependent oxidoreductase